MEPNQQPTEQPDVSPTPEEQVAMPEQSAPERLESMSDESISLPQMQPVQWRAVEYIQQDKQPLWYLGFAGVVVVLMVLAIWLMQAWTFAVLILVMAVALLVYAHRPPRELTYVLSEKGLYINDQLHPMGEFKSFGVVQNSQLNSLMLIPVKRFRPGLSVFFPTEVGEQVVDLLGAYLPMQDLKLDFFDKIVQKLRL
jgi:hypothetical protein